MSSPAPSPSDDKGVLPWIIQPGTYKWVDDILNTPLKQWGVIFACIILCIFCVIIVVVVMASGKPEEQSFGNFMKDTMKKKLVNLSI
jgi:hypothetical protein